jgi:cell wall-associated NlpC family hydrolase
VIDQLPPSYWQVPYVYERHPGAPGVTDLREGANCQLFAYTVLAHFGLEVPPLRSSDLWVDTTATKVVTELELLDLLFYNRTDDPFGAHIAVYLAPGQILHLCKEVGVPAIWSEADFAARPNYQVFVGARRVTGAWSCRT